MSMLVRVSRRRSVIMFPLVVTVDSVNRRDMLPFAFVVTDDSAVLEVMSFAFGLSATALAQNTAVARATPAAATVNLLFAFMISCSFLYYFP